jgi:hypothetical protein
MMEENTAETKKVVRHIQLQVPADLYKRFRGRCLEEDTNMRSKVLQLIRDYTETEDFLDMDRTAVEDLYAKAAGGAIAEHHKAGRYTTHGDDKGTYRLYPDGTKEYLRPYKGRR